MTKNRTPNSVEDALDQAIGCIGAAEVGHRIGKSESMVRKYADPDDDSRHLPVKDALQIDKWLARSGYPQVFALLFADHAEFNASVAVQLEEHGKPLAQATRMVCAAADVADEIQKAEADGVFDPAEVSSLLAQLERFQKRIGPLRKALYARQRGKSTS